MTVSNIIRVSTGDSPDGLTVLAVLLIAPGGSKLVKTPFLDLTKLWLVLGPCVAAGRVGTGKS